MVSTDGFKKKSAPSAVQTNGDKDELGAVIAEEQGGRMPLDEPTYFPEEPQTEEQIPEVIPQGVSETDEQKNTDDDSLQPLPPDTPSAAEGDSELAQLEQYRRESPLSRILPILIGSIITIALLITVIGGWILFQFLGAAQEASAAEQSFATIQQAIVQLDFQKAIAEFPQAHTRILRLERRVGDALFLSHVPFVGTKITATYASLQILDDAFSGGSQLLGIVADMKKELIATNTSVPSQLFLRSLSSQDKALLLGKVIQAIPTLDGVQATLGLVIARTNQIDLAELSPQLRQALLQTRDAANNIQLLINEWEPLAEVVPSFLGYPNEKTYLILLQDTSIPRATGGAILAYGILKLHNGEITFLHTDNVYNLDDKAKGSSSIPQPSQLHTYFNAPAGSLLLHDANWSPDFSTTAQQAENLYYTEGGHEHHLDGVLAATPDLIKSLLQYTGPIRIEGHDYSADTFESQLSFEISEGNYRRGIPPNQQKEIFGQLIAGIGNQLLQLPITSWLELYKTIEARLNEKQLLLFFHDEKLQSFARSRNWTGELRNSDGDYLMVIDTVYGTLQTESVMHKKVSYTMRQDPDGFLVSTIDLQYENRGTFSPATTRYTDFVRILVPQGSTLVSMQGADVPSQGTTKPTLEITQEHGKMQFGAFITVEPRHTKDLVIEYRLPNFLYSQVKNGTYSLLVQKQPGNANQEFNGSLSFLQPIVDFSPIGFFNTKSTPQTLHIYDDYRTDEEFSVTLQR